MPSPRTLPSLPSATALELTDSMIVQQANVTRRMPISLLKERVEVDNTLAINTMVATVNAALTTQNATFQTALVTVNSARDTALSDIATAQAAAITAVQNVSAIPPVASQVEAQAGVENTKIMSPLRVAQAIAFQAQTGVATLMKHGAF